MDHSESAFIRACRRESVPFTPVWFMRQAGRSLPEYREKRGSGSILDAIQRPELATELTLQPIRRYGVDAAILYSDIMVSAFAVDFGVEIQPGVGPVIDSPIVDYKDVERLRALEPEADIAYVLETVRNLSKELKVPLIGFTGAPFTIASYLIEGHPTRDWTRTKSLIQNNNDIWQSLMERLCQHSVASLAAQIDCGASAVQIFDSWVGSLSKPEYESFVLPYVQQIIVELKQRYDTPVIYFGTNTTHLLETFGQLKADVIGIDSQIEIDDAWKKIGNKAIQGNLDPRSCLEPADEAARKARLVLASANNRDGHVFNLGHGVLPETDPGVLEQLVSTVHEETKR